MVGFVKRLVKDRNYGFIRGDNRMEYFFHREDFEDQWELLGEGDQVTFDDVVSQKGPRAANVRFKN